MTDSPELQRLKAMPEVNPFFDINWDALTEEERVRMKVTLQRHFFGKYVHRQPGLSANRPLR